MAPAPQVPTGQTPGPRYPVWRIVISESKFQNGNNDVLGGWLRNNPDTASLEPDQFRGQVNRTDLSLLQGQGQAAPAGIKIDRIVWFTGQKPTPNPPTGQTFSPTQAYHLDADRIYYNRVGGAAPAGLTDDGFGNLWLPGGQYLVAGPRAQTIIGSSTTPGTPSVPGDRPYAA